MECIESCDGNTKCLKVGLISKAFSFSAHKKYHFCPMTKIHCLRQSIVSHENTRFLRWDWGCLICENMHWVLRMAPGQNQDAIQRRVRKEPQMVWNYGSGIKVELEYFPR